MRARTSIIAVWAAVCAVLGLAVAPALGHPGLSGTALIKVSPSGEISLILRHDALAFALDERSDRIADAPMLELMSASAATQDEIFEEGRARLLALTHFKTGSGEAALTLTQWPDRAGLEAWKARNPDRGLPVKMDFVGSASLPPGEGSFTVQFPKVLGPVLVTVERPGQEPLGFPLFAGEASLPLAYGASGAKVETPPPTGGRPEEHAPGEGAPAALHAPVRDLSWLDVAERYVWLGFTHIIPEGFDHVLFVMGLFLLTPRVKSLLWQITAFTIAHSVTLTLTTLHIIALPSIVIEPTIAASIAFVGIENLFSRRVRPWRAGVAFVFGLVHGMGFASALSEVGLPTGQLAAGLIAFNVGVECGHLTVLAGAFALLGWSRSKPWYRARVAIPLSAAISCVALYWVVQRVLSPG